MSHAGNGALNVFVSYARGRACTHTHKRIDTHSQTFTHTHTHTHTHTYMRDRHALVAVAR